MSGASQPGRGLGGRQLCGLCFRAALEPQEGKRSPSIKDHGPQETRGWTRAPPPLAPVPGALRQSLGLSRALPLPPRPRQGEDEPPGRCPQPAPSPCREMGQQVWGDGGWEGPLSPGLRFSSGQRQGPRGDVGLRLLSLYLTLTLCPVCLCVNVMVSHIAGNRTFANTVCAPSSLEES